MKKNHTVSSDQIPNYYRANRPGFYQWLGKYFLYILGWKVNGEIAGVKDGENLVVIVAPHTSNWDGALGLATIIGLDARISFIGKHTVFRFGLGWFLKSLGGIPVNRSVPGDVVLKIVKKIKNNPGTLFAMAPEGTRSKVTEWKSGFLRIAKEIKANVLMASIDFSAKEILLGDIYIPTGDNEKDIEEIKKYYSSFAPKYPDKF